MPVFIFMLLIIIIVSCPLSIIRTAGLEGPKSGAAIGAPDGTMLSGVMSAEAGLAVAAAGRSTFQALILVYHLPIYSRLSMSNETVSSSPGWMAACAILSAPNN